MAVKFPPAIEKDVFAVAFILVREPFEITIPGFDVLPRTRLRLFVPNLKFALPLIDRFGPAEAYLTVREFAEKLQPASENDVLAVAFRLAKEPLEMTMPGLVELPRIRLKLLLPKAKIALPLIDRFGPAETYRTVKLLAVKLPPAKLNDVLAVALRLAKEPPEITIPGLEVLPRTRLRLLLPKAKLALPLIDRF